MTSHVEVKQENLDKPTNTLSPSNLQLRVFLKVNVTRKDSHIHLLNPEKENLNVILMQHYLSFDWPGTEMTGVLSQLSLRTKTYFSSLELVE